MKIIDFVDKYGVWGEDIIWEIQEYTKKLKMNYETLIQYGEIEIVKDNLEINYTVGLPKPVIEELMLNDLYTNLDNRDRDKWENITELDKGFPNELLDVLIKEEKDFYSE